MNGPGVYVAQENRPWLALLCGPGSYPPRSDKRGPFMRINSWGLPFSRERQKSENPAWK
jgi:hypothetical protein